MDRATPTNTRALITAARTRPIGIASPTPAAFTAIAEARPRSTARLLTPPREQLDCDCDQRKTKYDGIGAEPPGQYKRADEGSTDQQHAVDHRHTTSEQKPP